MVIRLGRNGRFLACSKYPEHKESRPLPGEEPPVQEGDRRGLPEVRRGHARRQARPVRAVRRLLALPRLRLHQEGRPAAAGPAAVRGRLPQEPGRPCSCRAARAGPATSSGAAPSTPSATSRRTTSRSAALHDADDGPLARKGEAAICLRCGSTSDTGPDDVAPGERYAGGPADPEALARPARGRPGGARGGRGGRRPHQRSRRTRLLATRAPGRAGPRRVSGVAGDPCDPSDARSLPPVARRPGRVAPHDPRLRHGRRGLPRLARRARRRLGATRRARTCAPTSRAWSDRDALDRRPATRRDPLVLPLGGARRAGRRAIRGARSPRRACRAGCRGSSRSTR